MTKIIILYESPLLPLAPKGQRRYFLNALLPVCYLKELPVMLEQIPPNLTVVYIFSYYISPGIPNFLCADTMCICASGFLSPSSHL